MPSPPGQARPRIAIVSPGFYPLIGGAETVLLEGATRLSKQAEVRVFASRLSLGRNAFPGRRSKGPWWERTPSEVLVAYLTSTRLLGERWIAPWTLLRELKRFRPTGIWTSHPSASSFVAGCFARINQIRWVGSYHADLEPTSWIPRAFMKLEGWLLRGADAITVYSAHYYRKLVARGVPEHCLAVIQPCTAPNRLGGRATRLNGPVLPAAQPDPRRSFLFVGGMDRQHAYKSPDRLVAAVGELLETGLEARAVLAGGGEELPSLKQLARSLGVEGNVEFTGPVTDEELGRLYSSAWALVVPSRSEAEGFGLVMLEALSHGCPVLASESVTGCERFVRLGCAESFRLQGSPSLTEVLRRWLADPSVREEAASRARSLDLRTENEASLERLTQLVLGRFQAGEGPAVWRGKTASRINGLGGNTP